MKQYYQLVREYGKYDLEYVVYEAKKDAQGHIQIAAAPFTLVGNHPDEIQDTLRHIMRDIKANAPVDKSDCNVYHDDTWSGDDLFIVDPEFDAYDTDVDVIRNSYRSSYDE